MSKERQTRHFWVSGRVQGVCYRASAQQKARQLGLSGWVRNLPDGRVELVASGESAELDLLSGWLWQGPEMARVDTVQAFTEEYCDYPGFEVR